MKIYHTETQEDYDALMVELDKQGCKWCSGFKMKKVTNNWEQHANHTCVRVDGRIAFYDEKDYYAMKYPSIPIIKYKAKADDKMRFNKQNVEREFDKFMQGGDSVADLKRKILKLVNKPEKVVVPKFVADWIEWNKQKGVSLQTIIMYYKGFYDTINSHPETYSKKAVQWYVDNPYKFIQAYEDDYTIEPEQFYYIPLPELQTSDGLQQVLSKRDTYFASRPNEKLKQRYTKEELERVPEIYKPYAKPIEEEEECE